VSSIMIDCNAYSSDDSFALLNPSLYTPEACPTDSKPNHPDHILEAEQVSVLKSRISKRLQNKHFYY